MKRLFILLLLVNLGLAGWGYYRSVTKVVAPLPTRGGNLELLSERDKSAAARSAGGFDLEQRLPTIPPASPLPPSARAAKPGPTAGVSPSSTTLASAEPARPRAPPAGPSPGPAGKPAPQPAPDTQPHLQKCRALGAFDRRDAAEQVAGQLASLNVAAKLRQESVQTPNGFWVLIPPLASHDAAREMEKKLEAAGITDVWRPAKGDLQNAVSLGLFSRREAAERRRAQVVARGFAAEVRPRMSESDEFWLDFPVNAPIDSAALKRRFAHDYPDLKVVDRECVLVDTP